MFYNGGTIKVRQNPLGLGDRFASTGNESWTLIIPGRFPDLRIVFIASHDRFQVNFSVSQKTQGITSGWLRRRSPVKNMKYEEENMYVDPLGIDPRH